MLCEETPGRWSALFEGRRGGRSLGSVFPVQVLPERPRMSLKTEKLSFKGDFGENALPNSEKRCPEPRKTH